MMVSAANELVGLDGLALNEVRCLVVKSKSLVNTVTAKAGLDTINKSLLREIK